MITMTTVDYKNFGKCVKLDNGKASVIITVDAGPRVISYCLDGMENVLLEDTGRVFKDDGKELRDYFGQDETWYIYGGHRLWSSPESYPHSYVPDNKPVAYEEREAFGARCLVLTPPPTRTGQQHRLYVTLDDSSAQLRIIHELKNISGAIVTMAPWALTVCAAGGVEIFPQSDAKTGLLSNRRNVFWEYSDIHDDRFFYGNRYCTLRQVPGSEGKFKIGLNNDKGWAAVVNKGQIFIKRFCAPASGKDYPDFGCNFETFTNGIFLECESLGAIAPMANGAAALLEERWALVPCGESFDAKNEESIGAFAERYVIPNLPEM